MSAKLLAALIGLSVLAGCVSAPGPANLEPRFRSVTIIDESGQAVMRLDGATGTGLITIREPSTGDVRVSVSNLDGAGTIVLSDRHGRLAGITPEEWEATEARPRQGR